MLQRCLYFAIKCQINFTDLLGNSVKVLRTSDQHLYFWFSTAAWDAMINNKQWNNQVFSVKQSGSQTWSGNVVVWRYVGDSQGRREPNVPFVSGQWETGDTIKLAGKLVYA